MVPMHIPYQERHPHSWMLWFEWKHPKVKPMRENKWASVYVLTSPCQLTQHCNATDTALHLHAC